MSKFDMIATGNVTHAGVKYKSGDKFEVSSVRDMRYLIDQGAAKSATESEEGASDAVETGEATEASSTTIPVEIPTTVIEGSNVHEETGGSAVVANQPSRGVHKRSPR